jgi:putative membrane protein
MPTQPLQDDAERRTQLAADPTIFAAERTYSAWVRTGLAATGERRRCQKAPGGGYP